MRFTSFNKTVGWGAISQSAQPVTFATTPATITEDTSGTYIVNTVGLVNGTTLYWTINHITTNDAQFSSVSGSFSISSNSGTFSVSPISNWMTTPSTTFTVSIRTGSVSGPISITSSTTTVLHTVTTGVYFGGQNSGYYSSNTYRFGLNNTSANIFTYTSLAGSWNNISMGGASLTGVRNDGTLWVSGENRSGVMALSASSKSWAWLATADHILGVNSDGTLWAWGANTIGQLGLGDTIFRSSPVQVGTATNWAKIFAGGPLSNGVSIGIRTDGSMWAWGHNNYGQLGDLTSINRSAPVQIGIGASWVWAQASGGTNGHSSAMRSDLTLWTWGRNFAGQLGDGTTVTKSSPVQVAGSWTIAVSAPGYGGHMMGIKTDSTLWTWGYNNAGQLGIGTTSAGRSLPVQIGTSTWIAVGAGQNHSTAVKSTGGWYACGAGTSGQLGNGGTSRSSFTLVGTDSGYVDTACGFDNSFRLSSNGGIESTGFNDLGQLGVNLTGTASSFITIPKLNGQWTAVIPGIKQTIGIANGSGTQVYIWGDGTHGEFAEFERAYRSSPMQLTSATSEMKNSPVQIGSDTNWKYTANGALHTLAIKTDGTLWAWGKNSSGQLGDSTTVDKSSPIQVGSATDWAAVRCAGDYSFAIKNNFTLWAWGINTAGQLASNDSLRRSNPIQIAGSWIAVDSYAIDTLGHVVGLKTDYTLWSWGLGTVGQLGTNNVISRSNPQQIGSATWKQFSTGNQHTAAIQSDGSLWTWGFNSTGQLGLGITSYRSSPTQVGTSSWNFVSANDGSTLGVLVGNVNLFGWGRDLYGMQGSGASVQRSSPVQLSTGITTTTIKSISRGIPNATIIQT